jgi:hypothetical protein
MYVVIDLFIVWYWYYFIEMVLLFLQLLEAVHPLHDDKLFVPLLIATEDLVVSYGNTADP